MDCVHRTAVDFSQFSNFRGVLIIWIPFKKEKHRLAGKQIRMDIVRVSGLLGATAVLAGIK